MTSSIEEAPSKAGKDRLDRVVRALDLQGLALEVQGRIHRAAMGFDCDEMAHLTAAAFLELVGEFMRHLFWNGRGIPMRLSLNEGRARAVELLDAHYEGTLAPGYAGAYLDATNTAGPGIAAVLAELERVIIQGEIGHRLTGTLIQLVNPADWAGNRDLVKQLMNRMGALLPDHLTERPTDSLVPCCRELLELYLNAEGFIGTGTATTETPISFLPL